MRAVLFDVDGTLVESNHYHVLAWRAAFRAIGKDVGYAELHAQMGKGADQLLPVFLSAEELRLHGEALAELHSKIYLERYIRLVKPLPRVRELFTRIRGHARVVLASSAKAVELRHHLESLGIVDLIDGATSADDAERTKPCPDIFEAALALVPGVPPSNAIAVGDTPYDAQAANALGIAAIGVLTGGFPEDVLRRAGAIAVYGSVAELYERYEDSPLGREKDANALHVQRGR
jgi:HAD superfamily hydrolase (TIGR01509 family)